MKTKLLILALSGVFLAGCSHQQTSSVKIPDQSLEPISSSSLSPTPSPSSTSSTMEKQYTKEEIAKHNNANDCWFTVDGNVYDVTPFIKTGTHPGGAKILMGCGKDATEVFHTKAGKGQDHTETAQSNLPKYKIGIVAKS